MLLHYTKLLVIFNNNFVLFQFKLDPMAIPHSILENSSKVLKRFSYPPSPSFLPSTIISKIQKDSSFEVLRLRGGAGEQTCCGDYCTNVSRISCPLCEHSHCRICWELNSGLMVCHHCEDIEVREVSDKENDDDNEEVNNNVEFHDEHIQTLLQSTFGHSNFRNKVQKDAVITLMNGKDDMFVILPTGCGKSLIYQMAAVAAKPKVTVVVSPLLALIKDQIDHLGSINVKAETINSKMSVRERKKVKNDILSSDPQTTLLYVTPEQVATAFCRDMFCRMAKESKLGQFVIDEAHCVSQWGHDFRKDYLKLGELKIKTNGVPWICLTATASSKVVEDVTHSLGIKDYKMFRMPCFRHNIFYDVKFKNSTDVSIKIIRQ